MNALETERLIIRRFEAKDAREAHALFTDEEAMRLVALYPPLSSMKETEARIRAWREDGAHFAIVRKEDGALIGYIAVNPDSEEAREDTRELGVAALGAYRRKGYIREAVEAVLEELRREGITYVWACCFEGNDASKALIEKIGFAFQQEGTFEAKNDRIYRSKEYRMTLR